MITPRSSVSYRKQVQVKYQQILSDDAVDFLIALQTEFNDRRKKLLEERSEKKVRLENGEMLDFLQETADIRSQNWKVAPLPTDLWDRRVEITGPVDRKMIINALNSGARVFMADLEDSNSPSWDNCLQGQINLKDAIRREISYVDPNSNKEYNLNNDPAVLMVRPRGWHLQEENMLLDNEPLSASLFDFGLYFYHNAKKLIANGSGPYFYLPKIESHKEARLWNDVFIFSQNYLGIPQNSIKATVLIETINAVFEMDEILYELRNHSAGLNCGRWDYIFSYIKKFADNPDFLLPDRSQVTMQTNFMRAYSLLLIKTCHRRGVHAMGGMAAQIPIKNDPEANEKAMQKVIDDKMAEVRNGHDGTWVAHPALVSTAMDIFNKHMPTPNQIHIQRAEVGFNNKELLEQPKGTITEHGLRNNISVAIQYIEAWLRGKGAVAIHNLMEDAATAEIARAQVWQWMRHKAVLDDDRLIDQKFVKSIIKEESQKLNEYYESANGETYRLSEAVEIFNKLVFAEKFSDFLTLEAYKYLNGQLRIEK
ncbi:MAG: malate synthase A [Bacteroidia bacterium]|nr:malate synthase A [Bacteroidia bacterium]